MTKGAGPAIGAGLVAVVAAVGAVVSDRPALGLLAGLGAVVAAAVAVMLARRVDEQAALATLVDAELQALRAEQAGPGQDAGRRILESTDPGRPHHPSPPPEPAPADPGSTSEPASDDDSLVDPGTGLFSESFFLVAMQSRIAAARRHLRPVAMVLLDVVEGLPANEPSTVDAGLVAEAVKDTLREADTSCRLRNGYFALLLEDTPENGAIWTVERIRRNLNENREGLTIWAGVACYPAHAFSPEELLMAAEQALVSARDWRQDRIEVAASSD